jgi:hypothetical protein
MNPDELAKLIPDEVVSAALGNTGTLADAYHMRKALAAGLAAWPGIKQANNGSSISLDPHLIFPLQATPNAK